MKVIERTHRSCRFFGSALILILLASCSDDSTPNVVPDDEPTTTSGVTLFAPLGQTITYLIDEDGGLVNTWDSSHRPGLSAYLQDDGSLLRTASLGGNGTFGTTGGAGGRVEQFDWDGNLLWEFEYSSDSHLLHHDIEILPQGNILMIAWEYKSSEEAISAGRDPSLLADGELWPDTIIEVDPTGSIVWEWHV